MVGTLIMLDFRFGTFSFSFMHVVTDFLWYILGVKVPISILGAEKDQKWPPELLKKFGEALDAKPEVDGFVKIFPGAMHGC